MWPCPACTFLNFGHHTACSVCTTPKPLSPVMIPAHQNGEDSAYLSMETNVVTNETSHERDDMRDFGPIAEAFGLGSATGDALTSLENAEATQQSETLASTTEITTILEGVDVQLSDEATSYAEEDKAQQLKEVEKETPQDNSFPEEPKYFHFLLY